ncbi:MAG: hypothetical protein QGH45_06225 [Myxococcota bacterium]|nr:hypothetical protein [Myxococcota bacterium]
MWCSSSAPPATITSCSPVAMASAASPMAWVPLEQAQVGDRQRPAIPADSATLAAGL